MGTCKASVFAMVAASLLVMVQADTHFSNDPARPCRIIGDPDLYGPGIRYSLYLQWASLLIAFICESQEDVKNVMIASNVISLALLFSLFHQVSKDDIFVVDWIIVVWLTVVLPLGNGVDIVMMVWQDTGSRVTLAMMLLVMVSVLLPMPWVAYHAQRYGQKEVCIFVLKSWGSRAPFTPGFVRMFEAFSILGCTIGAVIFLFIVWRFPSLLCRDDEKAEESTPSETASNTSKHATMSESSERTRAKNRRRAGAVVTTVTFAAFAITSTENTIRYNNIDLSASDLTSIGQLIPFLTGVFNLVITTKSIFHKIHKWWSQDCEKEHSQNDGTAEPGDLEEGKAETGEIAECSHDGVNYAAVTQLGG